MRTLKEAEGRIEAAYGPGPGGRLRAVAALLQEEPYSQEQVGGTPLRVACASLRAAAAAAPP